MRIQSTTNAHIVTMHMRRMRCDDHGACLFVRRPKLVPKGSTRHAPTGLHRIRSRRGMCVHTMCRACRASSRSVRLAPGFRWLQATYSASMSGGTGKLTRLHAMRADCHRFIENWHVSGVERAFGNVVFHVGRQSIYPKHPSTSHPRRWGLLVPFHHPNIV